MQVLLSTHSSLASICSCQAEAAKKHDRERFERELAGTLDYSDERNYYQGVRIYDLATGGILRTFGRRGDYLYHITRQLPTLASGSPDGSQLLFSKAASNVMSDDTGSARALIATTGTVEGGATFWDALEGRALHVFSPRIPPEQMLTNEEQQSSHNKIPPLILTFCIDELLILYEYGLRLCYAWLLAPLNWHRPSDNLPHSQSTFSVYDLSKGSVLHESICIVEPPTGSKQMIKSMRPLDGVIFVYLKNPDRFIRRFTPFQCVQLKCCCCLLIPPPSS